MLKMLIPLLLLAIGTGAGIGGGLYLRPDPPADETAGPQRRTGARAIGPARTIPPRRRSITSSSTTSSSCRWSRAKRSCRWWF